MRVGTICYATEQGIGYLPKDFFDNGVVTDVAVFRHGSRPTHMEWYPEGTMELVGRPFTGPKVEAWLQKLDVLLQFETPFDWHVLALARKLKVRTAIVAMYECTPVHRPVEPDKWICPSLLDQRDYFPDSPFLPVPVNACEWVRRTQCARFLHNGGNLGLRGHKGTREILHAWKLCKRPIELTVRAQDWRGLRSLLQEVVGEVHSNIQVASYNNGAAATLHVDMRLVGRSELFPTDYDVFLMAEKYNGLSLPLQEAFAHGMVVSTSDRFPMHTWLPHPPLIPVASYSKQRVGGSYNWYEEANVDPRDIAAKLDEMYDWHPDVVEACSMAGRTYAEENSWEKLKPRWLAELSR